MNRVVPVVFVQALPIPAFAQVVGEVDGDRYLGRVVVLGAVVELPALDPPALRRSARCRPRSRLFTPTLVAHTGLQLADAHPTLRGLAVGAVEANQSLVAQWAVRSPARAYTVKARVAAGTWWRGRHRLPLSAVDGGPQREHELGRPLRDVRLRDCDSIVTGRVAVELAVEKAVSSAWDIY